MTERVEPSDVVDESMLGDEGPEVDGPEAGGVVPESSGTSIVDRLLATEEPHDVDPNTLEHRYGLSKGFAQILFGILKAAGTDGMPAIGNISLGTFYELRDRAGDRDDGGDEIETELDVVDETDRREFE